MDEMDMKSGNLYYLALKKMLAYIKKKMSSKSVTILCGVTLGVGLLLFLVLMITMCTRTSSKRLLIIKGEDGPAPSPPAPAPPAPAPARATVSPSRIIVAPTSGGAGPMELSSVKDAVERLRGPRPAVVMFYATRCGHCVRMKPLFEDVARRMRDRADFYMIESSSLGDMPQFSAVLPRISGFPTVITNQNGITPYVGGRGTPEIEKLVQDCVASRA
jgi:thiol-disulfide isomerase/thioredoxin